MFESIECIKQWSGKESYDILFDSDLHGNGGNGVLMRKILNKNNVCFIHFDSKNNIFGGYLNTTIDKCNHYLWDKKSFLFSLMRNGKIKNIKYKIRKNQEGYSFYLYSNGDYLYGFGSGYWDLFACRINLQYSCCKQTSFLYGDDPEPLIDNPGDPNRFEMKRILVLQMN
ncbi:TLDc domain-containing protein [Entamoeba marina]